MNPGMVIKDRLLVRPHHNIQLTHIFEQNSAYVWLFQPKAQLCMVVNYTDTSKKLFIFRQKGT